MRVNPDFLLAILISSLWLNLALFLARFSAKALRVDAGVHPDVLKLPSPRFSDLAAQIIQAELWEVVLPGFVYTLIYHYIPLPGVTAGIFFGLVVFLIGSLPQVIALNDSVRLPLPLLLHQLVWRLAKSFLIFGTFGYFFQH